ncbi:copper chaperone PCu(A)C [Luteimonas sp. TWI1437]|uniref:copper chaperone PCu(A)C n=1 Tax=unclassified Luteimonas TaxID=2629088 RepID=UPI00320B7B94
MTSFRATALATALGSLVLAACADRTPVPPPGANHLTIHDAWVKQPPPGAPVAAGYMTIHNDSDAADHLVSAHTRFADDIEIHTMRMANGMMQMRHLPDGIALPPNSDVALAPGGLHLMLMSPKPELAQASEIPITLVFEHGGAKTIPYPVHSLGGESAGDHAHGDAPPPHTPDTHTGH